MAEKTDTALPIEYKDKPSSPDSPDFAQGQVLDREGHVIDGSEKYKKLSWQRLTICLIVEAIALGSLGIPGAFADLGMAAGIILTIGLGLCAIYAGDIVGQVYCKYPHVKDFGDALGLIGGRPGYWIGSAMFCLCKCLECVYAISPPSNNSDLTLVLGSHALTGTIAWVDIVQKPGVCALVWSIISAIILFALALPPSFTEFAILGYVDFASIILAIGITIISTGIRAHQSDGGLSGVNWTALPPPDVTFAKAFNSVSNIIFAYSFTVCQFSFMAELHTPRDYRKAIWALGIAEIFIYTITGKFPIAHSTHPPHTDITPRQSDLRLCRPGREIPSFTIRRQHRFPHRVRRRITRDIHLRQHKRDSSSTAHHRPRLQELGSPLREHGQRLGCLGVDPRGADADRLGGCRGDPVLLGPARHHQRAVRQRFSVLDARAVLVLPTARSRGEVEPRLEGCRGHAPQRAAVHHWDRDPGYGHVCFGKGYRRLV